jgi:metal-responsive CopG/Arc/MetJ family transcriptional regulator
MPQAKGWKTIALPEELIQKIDKMVESQHHGYRSRNEFVTDAVRRRLEELKALAR